VNNRGRHIRDIFSDQKHAIDLLAAQNSEFHAMCEDHDACVSALEYWAKSKDPEAENRVIEYRTLIRDLQEEIIQALASLELSERD